MRSRRANSKIRSYEHLRIVAADVGVGGGMPPTPSAQAIYRKPVMAEEQDRGVLQALLGRGSSEVRYPPQPPPPNTPPGSLLWWVNSEQGVWKDANGTVPASTTDDDKSVRRMTDLTLNGNDIFGVKSSNISPPFYPSQWNQYEQTGPFYPNTSIRHHVVHMGREWQVLMPPSWLQSTRFNFFTAGGQWSYLFTYYNILDNGVLIKDGGSFSVGYGVGFGFPDASTKAVGPDVNHWFGLKDGVGEEDNGALADPASGTIIMTYNGAAGGLTKMYECRANVGFTAGVVTPLGTFTQPGITANSGLSIGNMLYPTSGMQDSGLAVDGDAARLCEQLSLLEAKIFSGILTTAQIQALADYAATFWGV